MYGWTSITHYANPSMHTNSTGTLKTKTTAKFTLVLHRDVNRLRQDVGGSVVSCVCVMDIDPCNMCNTVILQFTILYVN